MWKDYKNDIGIILFLLVLIGATFALAFITFKITGIAEAAVQTQTVVPLDPQVNHYAAEGATWYPATNLSNWPVGNQQPMAIYCPDADGSANTVVSGSMWHLADLYNSNPTLILLDDAVSPFSTADETFVFQDITDTALPSYCGAEATIIWDDTGSAPDLSGWDNNPAVSFIVPTASTTPRGEFGAWILGFENLSTSTTYTVEVDYIQTNTQLYNLYTDSGQLDPNSAFLPFGITKTTTLSWPTTTSTWDAMATLIDNSTDEGVASTTISFVMNSLQGAVSPPTGTSTLVSTCDSTDGFFQNSMCNVFVWLFYPSADSLNLFSTLSSSYGRKPPFGYFTAYYGALNSLQSGTSTLVLMDASSTEAFSPIFSPIRTGFAWLIPLLFAVWVMIRFKHLEL